MAERISCAILTRILLLGGSYVRYWMMRLFLTSRDEGTMFAILGPRESREQFLHRVFDAEIRFRHWQKPYVYKSFPSPTDDHIVGVIALEHSITISGPPEEEFVSKSVTDWETANVFLDVTSGDDGQKVAMQFSQTVGQPLAVFRSLVDQVNHINIDAEWMISCNPITRIESFWAAAERHKGQIQELDLGFVVPNIWGGESATEIALRKLKRENNAQEVEVRLKNREGQINPNSEDVRSSVDYITRGGGSLRLKDDGKIIYSSEEDESVVTENAELDQPVQESTLEQLRRLILRLFGK